MKLKIIFISLLIIGIITSGCVNEKSEHEVISEDNDRYVEFKVYTGSWGSYYPDVDYTEYVQYDDDLYVKVNNFDHVWEYPRDDEWVKIEITDYDISQPTKYAIKARGHVKLDGHVGISSGLIKFEMIVRDSSKSIISQSQKEIQIDNPQTVPFEIQSY